MRTIRNWMSYLLSSGLMLSGVARANDLNNMFDRWDSLLTAHVQKNGGVDYKGFAADQGQLSAWLADVARVDTKSLSDADKKALYINFYNAGMIQNVLRYAKEKAIALESEAFLQLRINDISVPGGNIWNGSYQFAFGAHQLTLDDIEHKLIRGQDPGHLKPLAVSTLDPRIHAAVNCAALSCPRVRETAYRGTSIDAMLDENMREFLGDARQFVLADGKKLKANSIVLW